MREHLRPAWTLGHRTVDGLAFLVVEAGPEGGFPLLLLHGFPDLWWGWRRQIDPLARAGYRVIVPNLRGYAGSDAPAGVAAYHLDRLAADVVGLADACGKGRFGIVAHDWGAVIGWRVAALHPDRVSRAVLMDGPHPDQFAAYAASHPGQALKSAYVAMFQPPWLPEAMLSAFGFAAMRSALLGSARPGTFAEADLDAYAKAWAEPGALTAMLNYYRALRLRRPDHPAAAITPPVLVLWGADDAFLEQGLAEAALKTCANGRLLIVPDAGHWLHLEQPAVVNTAILDFFA